MHGSYAEVKMFATCVLKTDWSWLCLLADLYAKLELYDLTQ